MMCMSQNLLPDTHILVVVTLLMFMYELELSSFERFLYFFVSAIVFDKNQSTFCI